MYQLTFLIGKLSVSAFLRKRRYAEVQEANFSFQAKCFIYKNCYLTRQYFTFLPLYLHHWLTYLIDKLSVSTISRKRTYAKVQEANFFFQARYFICKDYYLTRQYFTLLSPYPHSRTKISASSVVKERYQNSIIIQEVNSRAYKTAMPYVSKAGGSIVGHNANLISQ